MCVLSTQGTGLQRQTAIILQVLGSECYSQGVVTGVATETETLNLLKNHDLFCVSLSVAFHVWVCIWLLDLGFGIDPSSVLTRGTRLQYLP